MSNFGDLVKQFNWRFMLIRILVNAITLLLVALLVPKIYFVDRRILNLFFMAIALGILNGLIKPIVQFLTLPYIFATYGLIIAFINALLLLLLAVLFPDRFAVNSLFWVVVAGALMGIISTLLESLLGLSMPIVPEDPADLRQYVEEQRPGVIAHLLSAESEVKSHELADANRPMQLVDSAGEAPALPPQMPVDQPQGTMISSTVDPPSPAEPPPQDPLESDESQTTVKSEDSTAVGAETTLPPEGADETGDEAAVTKTRDNATEPDNTSQAGTQEGER